MNVAVGAKTDIGRLRHGNEDSFLVADPLFVVADGMGGHLAGDVASATAVQTIQAGTKPDHPEDGDALAGLVRRANEAIWTKSREDPSLKGMGTTCTALLLEDSTAHLAHVGDSRAYLLRSGEISQLSEDHTLVGRMVQEGRLSEEEARRHPQRSIITRALGVDEDVRIDVTSLELERGDRVLLCSDGLTSMVEDHTIETVLAGEEDPQAAADRLVELANEAGGEDNITVVVLHVTDRSRPPPPPSPGDGAGRARVIDPGASPPAATPTSEQDRAGPPVVEEPAEDPAGSTSTSFEEEEQLPPAEPLPEPHSRRRPWLRRLGAVVVGLLVLAAVAYGSVRYLIRNSWFVGVDGRGRVAIFQGSPDQIAGFDLKQEVRATDLALAQVPQFKQQDVREGISADSPSDARSTVRSLERLARQHERTNRTRKAGNNQSKSSGKP